MAAAAALALAFATGGQFPSPRAWAEADAAIVRLDPSAFPELPRVIQDDLRRRGCSIPQPYGASRLENVIRGPFFREGRLDWAVLCSREGSSSILVFPDANRATARKLATLRDADFLQTVSRDRIGFSRAIEPASVEYIRKHDVHAHPAHAGINDVFVGKASIVWYWDRNRWVRVAETG